MADESVSDSQAYACVLHARFTFARPELPKKSILPTSGANGRTRPNVSCNGSALALSISGPASRPAAVCRVWLQLGCPAASLFLFAVSAPINPHYRPRLKRLSPEMELLEYLPARKRRRKKKIKQTLICIEILRGKKLRFRRLHANVAPSPSWECHGDVPLHFE